MRIQEPLVKASFALFLFIIGMTNEGRAAEAVPGQYLVKLNTRVTEANLPEIAKKLNSEIKSTIAKHQIVVIQKSPLQQPKSVITQLEANPMVEVVEPNYIFRA